MTLVLKRFQNLRRFLYRALIALIILAVTLAVSAIWEKMVYTIPVLAVLLFLAAGIKELDDGSTRRNLDEEATDIDTDAGVDSG